MLYFKTYVLVLMQHTNNQNDEFKSITSKSIQKIPFNQLGKIHLIQFKGQTTNESQ